MIEDIKVSSNLKEGHKGVFLIHRKDNKPSFYVTTFFCYETSNPLNCSFRYHDDKGKGEYRIPLGSIREIVVIQKEQR